MKKRAFTLFIIIATCATHLSAQSLLDTFVRTLSSMGRLSTEFVVNMTEQNESMTFEGSYIAEGQNVYVKMQDIEIYAADGVKYEVNSQSKEIIVDSAATLGDDLFTNPKAFLSNLTSEYNTLDTELEGLKAVLLTHQDITKTMQITILANDDATLPETIVMEEGTTVLTVGFDFKPSNKPIPRFSRDKYPDFELIDMR